eukprot:GSMAST32.ASY1.ANO1.1787.1 assembled CDS
MYVFFFNFEFCFLFFLYLLQEKLEKHDSNAYLVNTGWTGGAYGVGERMFTRACIDSILDGSISNSTFVNDSIFGFQIPQGLPGVSADVCNPRNAWDDKNSYDVQAAKLADMFRENFKKYSEPGVTDYTEFGPK